MSTIKQMICKPFTVFGMPVTSGQIADAIDDLANAPVQWMPSDLAAHILPNCGWQDKQEALNRLMQRWRKLDLCRFKNGKWMLSPGARTLMQLAASSARSDDQQKGLTDEHR